MKKICGKCGTLKSIDEFYIQPRGKYGRDSSCKSCKKSYSKEWSKREIVRERKKIQQRFYIEIHKPEVEEKRKRYYEKNKEVFRQKNREFYQKNIFRLRKKRRNYDYKRRYGIEFKEKEEIFQNQQEKCLICGKKLEDIKKSHLDHSHSTGKIRGILCASCNWWVGFFEKRKELFIRIKKYLVH